MYDWSKYAVGGAASRPDSFTGLNPEFAEAVWKLTQDAHAAGHPLQITSAYRSPEVQAKLYEQALAKHGSPEKARKWVAPPGRSQHNRGTAVDYAVNGSLLRDADNPAAQWLSQNASKYGLDIPMSWEPWQVEMAGARGQTAGLGTGPTQARADAGLPLDTRTPPSHYAGLNEPKRRPPPEFVQKGNAWLEKTFGLKPPTDGSDEGSDELIALGMQLMNRGYF